MLILKKVYLYLLAFVIGCNALFYPFAVDAKTLNPGASQRTEEEKNPNIPEITVNEIAPGLVEKTYRLWKDNRPVTAYFLEADKNYYSLLPALDHDTVPGREVVSQIAAEHGAVAAINASYFAVNGELLGITRMEGLTTGTTYFTRTGLGIRKDGSPHISEVSYDGYVTLGEVTLPVSGVDAECGENGTVVFNRYYGNSNNANEYTVSYVIKNDKVVLINPGATDIPDDGVVVTVHGSSIEAFKDVQVGDAANIYENLGEEWSDDTYILGAGPRLVKDGEIHVTVAAEKFPGDIRYGRAPRAGFGISREGNYIFAVVDGRQRNHSIGVTLTEFAQMFLDMGAIDALNFDGGGSATLVINGNVINSPSDGGERKVGSALLLMKKENDSPEPLRSIF